MLSDTIDDKLGRTDIGEREGGLTRRRAPLLLLGEKVQEPFQNKGS